MTNLYTEALKDAQKLRDIAEADAKKRIVEALTPYIKKVIAKEAAGDSDFYFEQLEGDEDEDALDLSASAAANPPATEAAGLPNSQASAAPTPPQAAPELTTTSAPTDILGDDALAAPIETPAADELVNGTMPDADGKITVDFEDLFVDGESDEVTITPAGEEPPMAAPVAPTGGEEVSPDLGMSQMPAGAPEAPVSQPAAAAAAAPVPGMEEDEDEENPLDLSTEAISYKDYRRVFSNISERIDRTLYTNKVSGIVFETLKQRLFHLLEAVDTMQNRGIINNKQAQLNENKLEFLFIKLKEASLHNSYSSNDDKGPDMKTLKEFAAQLFEEDENLGKDTANSGETGVPVDDEYSDHAAKVSGVDPKLGGGAKDVEASQKNDSLEGDALPGSCNADEEPWDQGVPVVRENSAGARTDANDDVAEGAAGFGDTDEEPCAEFEVDDAELAEAVRSIRKKSIKKKLSALREAEKKEGLDVEVSEDYPDPGPADGEDPSHEKLKEMLEMAMNEMDDDDDMGELDGELVGGAEDAGYDAGDMAGEDEEVEDYGSEMPMGEEDADLVLSIDLPPEVEEELAELGLDDLDVDVALNVSTDLEGEEGMGDDEEIEIVDDDEDPEDSEGLVDEEVLEDGNTDETDEMDEMDEMKEMRQEARKYARKARLLEKKLQKAAKFLRLQNNKLTNLEEQLVETNLFTSKAVYYSKFLQRALTEKALSKKALQQIVEHLDKGRSVAETKAIYKKIENKLNEHANASRKLGGSSSKVTRPGSANLTEGADRRASKDPNTQTSNRWQLLAGIKKGGK